MPTTPSPGAAAPPEPDAARPRDARSRPQRVLAAVFPGRRIVWAAALVAVLIGGVLGIRLVSAKVLPLTGTNSVDVAAVVSTAKSGQRFCVRDLVVPKETGRVQVWMGFPRARGAVEVEGVIRERGRTIPVAGRFDSGLGDWKTFTLASSTGKHGVAGAELCLRATGSTADLGGSSVQRIPGRPVSVVGRQQLAGADVGVRFLTPAGDEPRVLSQIDDALRRSVVFKDFPGGSLLLWVFLLGFPLVGYGVIRVAATAERRSARNLAIRAAGVALFAGLAWAVMMPPFFGADESEHVAYAQHLAETNHRADAQRTDRPPYSSEEELLLGALHHNSTILSGGSRPRWDEAWDRAFDRLDGAADRSNGGGYTESATGHSPLYYEIVGVPYRILSGALDLPQLNVAMRAWNALLAAGIAFLAVLAAALVFPRARASWWMAGCVVALQPVASSVAGSVNNDTLVNLLAALVVYLLLHGWRHGPRRGTMTALGVATLLLPVAKITGFALWPAVAVGIVCIVARHHDRRSVIRLLTVPAALAVAALAWIVVLSPIFGGGTGALHYAHPSGPAVEGATGTAGITRVQQVQYLLQTILPSSLFGGHMFVQSWPLYGIYVERGWGSFGWLNAHLNERTVKGIGVLLGLGWVLTATAAAQRWRTFRAWGGSAVILGAAVACVVTFVAVAYATPSPRPVFGEQGRYLFPALVPLGVLVGAGALAFKERGQAIVVGLVAGGMPAIALLAWTTALRSWFV